MRRRFPVEQIVAVLKQAGLESDQVRGFRQIAEEDARPKRLVAGLGLDEAVLQDVPSKKFPGPRPWRRS